MNSDHDYRNYVQIIHYVPPFGLRSAYHHNLLRLIEWITGFFPIIPDLNSLQLLRCPTYAHLIMYSEEGFLQFLKN